MTANRGAVALMDTRIENPYSLNRVATEAKLQAQRAEKLRPEVNRLSGDVKRLHAHLAELEQQLAAKTAEWTDADTQARDYARMASLFARENGVSLNQGEAPMKPTSEWAPVDPATTVLPPVQQQPPANLPAWASGPDAAAKLEGFLREQQETEQEPAKPEPADDKRDDDGDPPATGGTDAEQADQPENGKGGVRGAISEFVSNWFSHKGRRIAAAVTT